MLDFVASIKHTAILTLVLTFANYAHAEPKYVLDSGQNKVLRLNNLTLGTDCSPMSMSGKVVKRTFDTNGTIVESVVIEQRDGSRTNVNFDLDLKDLGRVQAGWIVDGLQKLLKVGRTAKLVVMQCGAAGRMLFGRTVE